jgi:hypothetical protein
MPIVTLGPGPFFLTDHPFLAKLWGPLVGPLVAVISFVCSVGNIPLATVLWNNGISFGVAIRVSLVERVAATGGVDIAALCTRGCQRGDRIILVLMGASHSAARPNVRQITPSNGMVGAHHLSRKLKASE